MVDEIVSLAMLNVSARKSEALHVAHYCLATGESHLFCVKNVCSETSKPLRFNEILHIFSIYLVYNVIKAYNILKYLIFRIDLKLTTEKFKHKANSQIHTISCLTFNA